MPLIIYAAVRLKAEATWFDSLTEEQQSGYLAEHPNSKYSKNAKPGVVKPSVKPTKSKPRTKPSAKPGKSTKVSHQEIHKFAVSDEAKPHSETRRSFGQFLKDHAKGLIHHMKEEVKEAATAGKSALKLMRGGKLTHEEHHALKTTAVHLAIVCGSLAIGGGLSAALASGVSMAAEAIGKSFAAHMISNVAEKTLMHSAVDDADKGLQALTKEFIKYIETSPDVQKILSETANQEENADED